MNIDEFIERQQNLEKMLRNPVIDIIQRNDRMLAQIANSNWLNRVNEIQNIFSRMNISSHINQLNRYLSDQFGSFGILFTRNKPPKSIYRNTIDLWSGHRKCILILTDEDLKLMCKMFEGKQRLPIDVLKMKYIEFTRDLPS